MDEPIISIFHTKYYVRAICGAILFLLLAGYMLYLSLFGNLETPANAYFFAAFLFGFLCIYFYFFSKSWKRITVTPTEIIVFDVVFKKQLTIPYTDITRISTYRSKTVSTWGSPFSQNFVIEFNRNKSVALNEAWYDNYNRLKMAIYNYKYGPGHGRDRYLARRGSEA